MGLDPDAFNETVPCYKRSAPQKFDIQLLGGTSKNLWRGLCLPGRSVHHPDYSINLR